MNEEMYAGLFIILILVICYVIYLFRNVRLSKFKEGMITSAKTNGVAGNSSSHAANIKSHNVKYQDQLHISKYSTDYENVILEMDDYINNRMLHTALSMDVNNPHETLSQLAQMDLAKSALNKVMVFIDKH